MRVLSVGNLYPPHSLGGYEAVWHGFMSHLRARGDDVRVLTTETRFGGVQDVDEPDVHRELRWYWRDHEFPSLGRRERHALERHDSETLHRHLDAFGPDAVMWWSMGGLPMGLLAQGGSAAIGVVHDAWLAYGPRVDQGAHGMPDLQHIAWWSFNSAFTREQAKLAGARLAWDRTSVEHPGIDVARVAPAPPGDWGWRLACVGRIDERKGVSVAIEALELLPEETTLTITGGGDEVHLAHLRELAAPYGDRVRFAGAREDVATAYAEADAVLFPVTWDEPFGLVPLEAMAVGRPVVATGTGGSAEVLRDGENALVVAPGDAAALAGAVRRVAGDEVLRERLRRGGAETAMAFTSDAFNAGLEERVRAIASWPSR